MKFNFVIENNFDLQQTKNQEGIGLKNLKTKIRISLPKKAYTFF